MNSVFKDKLGNEWYCKYTKKQFEQLSGETVVEAYNNKGSLTKKFMRSYLEFVKEIGDEEEVVAEVVLPPPVEATKKHKRKEVVTDEEPVEREQGEAESESEEESSETSEIGAQPTELVANESDDE
jgi:hypothetical protein